MQKVVCDNCGADVLRDGWSTQHHFARRSDHELDFCSLRCLVAWGVGLMIQRPKGMSLTDLEAMLADASDPLSKAQVREEILAIADQLRSDRESEGEAQT